MVVSKDEKEVNEEKCLQNQTTSDNFEIILQKATELFAGKGYDAVGIQEVFTASGITKPTLYYYFKSKTGLLEAIINDKGSKLVYSTKVALFYEHEFFDSLLKVLKSTRDFAEENPDYFRLHLNLLASPKDSEGYKIFEIVREQLSDTFLQFFKDSAAEFGNMRGKENLYAVIFCNLVNQTVLAFLNGELTLDDDMSYKIVHSFIWGVAS